METKRTCEGLDEWEIKSWLHRLGSFPIRRIDHADHSESYTMDEGHVLALENGQFALVTESGCSCYSCDDADIDLFPDYSSAKDAFDKWDREHRGS